MEDASPKSEIRMKLDQDNQATIRTILHDITSWRTRHYALRAAWTRDIIHQEGIEVEHVPGVEICADPLTKVLGKVKLVESHKRLQLVSRNSDRGGGGSEPPPTEQN